MAELLLARHGETEWSLNGRHTGSTDIPLTDNGRRRARNLASRLDGRDFALVLTSPMQRAMDTCKLAGLGERAQVRDDLREWDYGDYEGVTTAQIHERDPSWSHIGRNLPVGGARADRVIAEARQAGGDVILFGHGHMLRVVGARWVGLPPQDGGLLGLGTGALCTLGYEHGLPILVHWNEPVS